MDARNIIVNGDLGLMENIIQFFLKHYMAKIKHISGEFYVDVFHHLNHDNYIYVVAI